MGRTWCLKAQVKAFYEEYVAAEFTIWSQITERENHSPVGIMQIQILGKDCRSDYNFGWIFLPSDGCTTISLSCCQPLVSACPSWFGFYLFEGSIRSDMLLECLCTFWRCQCSSYRNLVGWNNCPSPSWHGALYGCGNDCKLFVANQMSSWYIFMCRWQGLISEPCQACAVGWVSMCKILWF